MIKEAFVSYDIALRLREKGFNEYGFAAYSKNCEDFITAGPIKNSDIEDDERFFVTAPTQQMAMRWLREAKGIHIAVNLTKGGRNYETDIFKNGKFFSPAFEEMEFETYELAVAFGLLFVLTKMEL